jgi:hypothetical protein
MASAGPDKLSGSFIAEGDFITLLIPSYWITSVLLNNCRIKSFVVKFRGIITLHWQVSMHLTVNVELKGATFDN